MELARWVARLLLLLLSAVPHGDGPPAPPGGVNSTHTCIISAATPCLVQLRLPLQYLTILKDNETREKELLPYCEDGKLLGKILGFSKNSEECLCSPTPATCLLNLTEEAIGIYRFEDVDGNIMAKFTVKGPNSISHLDYPVLNGTCNSTDQPVPNSTFHSDGAINNVTSNSTDQPDGVQQKYQHLGLKAVCITAFIVIAGFSVVMVYKYRQALFDMFSEDCLWGEGVPPEEILKRPLAEGYAPVNDTPTMEDETIPQRESADPQR